MAVTVSLYDHTSRLFAQGSNDIDDVYKLMLCTAATFNPTDYRLSDITKTETPNGNGYTSGGQALNAVSVTSVTSNDAKFTADPVTWSAEGGSIVASYAILYNDTDENDPPLLFIDFGGEESAPSGTDMKVVWNSSGIFSFTAT